MIFYFESPQFSIFYDFDSWNLSPSCASFEMPHICMTWFELFCYQDIMILPTGAGRFEEALQMGSETYHHLKVILLNQIM